MSKSIILSFNFKVDRTHEVFQNLPEESVDGLVYAMNIYGLTYYKKEDELLYYLTLSTFTRQFDKNLFIYDKCMSSYYKHNNLEEEQPIRKYNISNKYKFVLAIMLIAVLMIILNIAMAILL